MSRKRKTAADRFRIEADHGPAERYQHGDVIVSSPTETAGISAKRVMTQRTLDRYAQREEIDARQYSAGDALYRLWYAAGRSPKLTLNLLSVGGSDENAEDRKAGAWADLNQALRAVGQRLSPILVHVCLTDGTASAWAKQNGHDPRGGLTVLRLALDALGDYLRLPGGGR
ncbi:MAG: DUF6456 domain-containing protein [Pseudomonadota bacterium]